jgi:hypothetical protein
MTVICRNRCYDRDPLCLATSAKALWLKCSVCGTVNIRLRQTANGSVNGVECVEGVGEIDVPSCLLCDDTGVVPDGPQPGPPYFTKGCPRHCGEDPGSEQVQPTLAELRAHYSR